MDFYFPDHRRNRTWDTPPPGPSLETRGQAVFFFSLLLVRILGHHKGIDLFACRIRASSPQCPFARRVGLQLSSPRCIITWELGGRKAASFKQTCVHQNPRPSSICAPRFIRLPKSGTAVRHLRLCVQTHASLLKPTPKPPCPRPSKSRWSSSSDSIFHFWIHSEPPILRLSAHRRPARHLSFLLSFFLSFLSSIPCSKRPLNTSTSLPYHLTLPCFFSFATPPPSPLLRFFQNTCVCLLVHRIHHTPPLRPPPLHPGAALDLGRERERE